MTWKNYPYIKVYTNKHADNHVRITASLVEQRGLWWPLVCLRAHAFLPTHAYANKPNCIWHVLKF